MSFLLGLQIHDLTEEQGKSAEAVAIERGALPIRFAPHRKRRFRLFGPRETGPGLWMPEQLDGGQDLLGDNAEWDAPSWALNPEVLPRFADAILILGELLPQGFALRATWVGSEVRDECVLSYTELADLARASKLNEFTRYSVPPRVA